MKRKLAVFLVLRNASFSLSAVALEIWCILTMGWPLGTIFGIVLPIVLAVIWALFLSTSPVLSTDIYLRSFVYLSISLFSTLSLIDLKSTGLAIAHLVTASLIGFGLIFLD